MTDISACQTSIMEHVQAALGIGNWNYIEGAPRGYSPPQVNVWWLGIPLLPPPEEIQEIQHRWAIRITKESASDPERQDAAAVPWELVYAEWAKMDAIALGGNCQLSWPMSVELVEVEEEGMLYVGVDITLAVIVKTARVFTA